MAIIIRNKKSGDYLEEPTEVRVGDNHVRELWRWTSNIDTAARFANRIEAKETIRRIRPEGVKGYTFHDTGAN